MIISWYIQIVLQQDSILHIVLVGIENIRVDLELLQILYGSFNNDVNYLIPILKCNPGVSTPW